MTNFLNGFFVIKLHLYERQIGFDTWNGKQENVTYKTNAETIQQFIEIEFFAFSLTQYTKLIDFKSYW